MNTKMDIEYLMDAVNEYFDSEFDYIKSSKRFYRKHGYGVVMDRAKTDEERHIVWAYHNNHECDSKIIFLTDVLQMDTKQINRLYSAGKFVRTWREKTNYERLIPEDLAARIERYIFG